MKSLKMSLADWLGKQSEKQKAITKKIILICCCLFVGGYCMGLVLGLIGFQLSEPQGITKPVFSKEAVVGNGQVETTGIYIKKFRNYMDSLGTSVSGRAQRDSILQRHPGIMDTVAMLEKMIIHSK